MRRQEFHVPQYRWVSVTTVLAPAWFIRLHAAYLKLLGADQCVYFIDDPQSYTQAELDELAGHAKLVVCDDAYFQSVGGRERAVSGRQLKNVVFARSHIDARWFLHIDIDEFPHVTGDVGRMLDGAPEEISDFHFQNVERLIVGEGPNWHDGVFRLPNFDRELQQRHYGERSRFLGAGLACYIHGKSLVRNKPHVVQGVHTAMSVDPNHELVRMTIPLHEGFVVHYPCITPQHLAYRMRRNRYRMPWVRKFRHEHMLDEFIFAQGTPPEEINNTIKALHTCTAEQALAWSEAGLCRPAPDAYLQRMVQAAGTPEVLGLGYAERSFGQFHRSAGSRSEAGKEVV